MAEPRKKIDPERVDRIVVEISHRHVLWLKRDTKENGWDSVAKNAGDMLSGMISDKIGDQGADADALAEEEGK